jgi:hypothetical protein
MAACYKFPDIEGSQKLYQALVFLLEDRFGLEKTFPQTIKDLEAIAVGSGGVEDDLPLVVTIFGLLYQDNIRDPLLGRKLDNTDVTNGSLGTHHVSFVRRFVQALTGAVEEFQGSKDMFAQVFATLVKNGATKNGGGSNPTVYAHQVAEVGRRLIGEGRSASDPQIEMRISNVLSVILGDGVEGRSSAIDISLPNLDEGTTSDIIQDNVKALAALYFAAQLEELKFFATADKVLEHFMTGMLPLSRGPGGDAIYEYMKGAPNRLTEAERRSLYARCFGFAQGSVEEPLPNREFQDTWIRFLSAESQFVRLFGSTGGANGRVVLQGPLVPIEQVFKAAKDLGVNLSLHGYGIAHFAAVELQKFVRQVKDLLSFDDVLKAYGVLDPFQLVERISQLYLGGSVNGVQKRTMATAGANIIQWIAKNAPVLAAPESNSLVKLILEPGKGPFDDIANNVERWLAVTGTVDDAVEKFAEPVSMPTQSTIPNLSLTGVVPDSLRSVLAQVGNGLPSMQNMQNMSNMPALTVNGVGKA